jgi:hypothetical protein
MATINTKALKTSMLIFLFLTSNKAFQKTGVAAMREIANSKNDTLKK